MSADPAAAAARGRRLPPVDVLTVASLALVVVGGILMASYVPRRPPLAAPSALAAAGAALALASVLLLARLQRFAWDRFFAVFGWALLAYLVSAAMIGFAFIRDHTSGGPLALVVVMLAIYAVDVPLVIAFTVARYASPPYSPR
jgi:hypothetical protein